MQSIEFKDKEKIVKDYYNSIIKILWLNYIEDYTYPVFKS